LKILTENPGIENPASLKTLAIENPGILAFSR